MAIGSTVDTFSSATKTVGIEYRDAYAEVRTYAAPMIATMVKADIDALAALLDPLTNAYLCEGYIDKEKFLFTGGQAAADAIFPDVYDRMELEFVSITRCAQVVKYSVLAPIEAAFLATTGGRKVVDSAQTDVAALGAWLSAHLKTSNYGGLTDWAFKGGRRQQDPLPDCII